MKKFTLLLAGIILIIFGRHIITYSSTDNMTTIEWISFGVLVVIILSIDIMGWLGKKKK